jgi:uncharacterized membrane protein
MEWLFILPLAAWAWLQSQRIDALTRRLADLERGLAAAREPLLLTHPLPPDDDDVLVLDTPLPEASNDAAPVTPLTFPDQPATTLKPKQSSRRFEKWLAENGFAWLGGGAVTLGVIFLVAFATQQGWFTPLVRLTCALILGFTLIAASEWTRRLGAKRPPGHPLVGAMLAGAGVASLYAVTWAAYGLYHYLGWGTAAAMLLLCAIILGGLSLLHGQALGALAIVAALLAPPLTSLGGWSATALTLYVCAASAAGLGLAALRRWAWVAVATMGGLYLWFAAAIAADEVWRALTLLSFASIGAAGLVLRAPLTEAPATPLSWGRTRALAPSIAISVSSVLLLWTWLAIAPAPSHHIVGPALIGAFHVALAASALRARLAAPATLVIAIGALALGFVAYLRNRFYFAPLGEEFFPAVLLAAFTIAASASAARPHRSARSLVAAAGALGAALLTALAASTAIDWHGIAAWAPLFVGAGLLFGAAWRGAREGQGESADRAVDLWAGASAALLLLGVESAFTEAARVVADAGAALLLAAGFTWRGWRALRWAALSAAALSLAHAFAPALMGAALSGTLSLWRALLVLAAAAALLYGAARFAGRRVAPAATAEALHAAAIISLLIAAFLALRWIAGGGAGAPLDAFTESALRTLGLLAAGHILMPRQDQRLGHIGQWRGHVLMGTGLLVALLSPALALNPWWGEAPATITGPLLLNAQALAFAAPAAIAVANAARLPASQPLLARCYVVAGAVLGLVWLPLEIRHAFHGANMSEAGFVGLEGFAHALWPLALALAASAFVTRSENPRRDVLLRACGFAVWPALVAAGLGLWLIFNPWWGLAPSRVASPLAALAGLVGLTFTAWASAIAPRLQRAPWPMTLAQAATIASVGHVIVTATLIVRWLHHHADMAAAPTGSAEMWTYSAVWALLGAGVFWFGTQRDDAIQRWSGIAILLATTGKVLLLDMAQLTGIIRVGSFLGLGAILLTIAWRARRFGSARLR